MRVYGRQMNWQTNTYEWVEIATDPSGFNDAVYLTAFCQALQLQLGESPFFAQWGIPAFDSIQNQTYPTKEVYFMQQQYSPNFFSLGTNFTTQPNKFGAQEPVYNVKAITQKGAILNAVIPI